MAQYAKTFRACMWRWYKRVRQVDSSPRWLEQIADFHSRSREMRGKVVSALIYPAVLLTLAVAVVIFLMTFFIPRFKNIFAEFGASLRY